MTYLVDIHPDDCVELLASTPLGRLAVMVDGDPEVFPVNHVDDRERGCVVFPTNSDTTVHAALGWSWVAFEVDGIDPDGSGGWRVLVVGRAGRSPSPTSWTGSTATDSFLGGPGAACGGCASCRRR